MAINAVLSLAFFVAVFGTNGAVTVWGLGNLAFDAIPQSFAVAFMASLMPGLLALKAISTGKIQPDSERPKNLSGVLTTALRNGVLGAVAGSALWVALLLATSSEQVGYLAALVAKVGYGALLGAATTYFVLKAQIGA